MKVRNMFQVNHIVSLGVTNDSNVTLRLVHVIGEVVFGNGGGYTNAYGVGRTCDPTQ